MHDYNQWESRWFLVVSSACMSTSYKNSPPHVSFFRVAQARMGTLHRFVGIDRLLYPWPRAINYLVHWSSPVQKLVFSQQYGPVRRSSPVRKLVATPKMYYERKR